MDECREEFESWIKSETGLFLHRTQFPMTKHEDQQYYDHDTNLAWLSWKASRESMKAIKLPDYLCSHQTDGDYCSAYNTGIEDSKDAIKSSGYKVEE